MPRPLNNSLGEHPFGIQTDINITSEMFISISLSPIGIRGSTEGISLLRHRLLKSSGIDWFNCGFIRMYFVAVILDSVLTIISRGKFLILRALNGIASPAQQYFPFIVPVFKSTWMSTHWSKVPASIIFPWVMAWGGRPEASNTRRRCLAAERDKSEC